MEKRQRIDLRSASYEDLVDFVFNHVPQEEVGEKWYWQVRLDLIVDPGAIVGYLHGVCTQLSSLLQRFTVKQVTEGLLFMFGGGGGKWFRDQFWNADVPWIDRRRSVLAIPELYPEFFERYDDDGLGFMLWDYIASYYSSRTSSSATNVEEVRVQQAMFEAMTIMLQSHHPDTQAAAVHGLGHLSHPKSGQAIRDFLSASRELDIEVRNYAVQVLEGDFQ